MLQEARSDVDKISRLTQILKTTSLFFETGWFKQAHNQTRGANHRTFACDEFSITPTFMNLIGKIQERFCIAR